MDGATILDQAGKRVKAKDFLTNEERRQKNQVREGGNV
jgi:hypothetical protein